MSIIKIAEQVKSKDDFISFLQKLLSDYQSNQSAWENPELGRYIEAMERYLDDSKENSISKVDFTPSWSLFAKIMVAATLYE